MSGSVEIKDIVDYLKNPPFNRTEGLVDFSKKSPLELLQVVNDVFAEMDDRQRKDLRDETKDAMTARLLEFVTVLGYKIEGDISRFGENFMNGNPLVIYPFLHWTLENFEKNKTRSYLARYLRPFSIPEEHFADNQIVNMYQQYQTRQNEFKELHMQLEEVRKTASNPASLQAEVTQLENEKEQLHNKLEKLRARITNDTEYQHVNFDEMLSVTNKLRQEQETEAKLYQDLAEQRAKLQRAEQIRNATAKKFQEMNHSDMGKMDPLRLIAKLKEEVGARRTYMDEKLENQISEREKQLKHLAKVANNNQDFTQDDLHNLAREKHDLSQEIDELLQRRENMAGANDSKITFVRDRLANVDKKKDKLVEQVNELEDEKRETENELKRIVQEFKALTGSANEDALLPNGQPRPKTDAQMKDYMNELNKKTQRYKTLKGELEYERSEIQILARTEEVLRARDSNIAEFNEQQEKRLGVVGYSSAQDNLEAISAAKAGLDQAKGETLEEMTEIVERIKATLAKKKERLTPQITALRSTRSDYEAIEATYKQKKNQYENMSLSYESDRLKLEQDVAQHVNGINEEESQFHFLNCFAAINNARNDQISKLSKSEEKQGSGVNYKELYEKAISDQEAVTKTLRNEKKNITENHEDHVAQRSMFQALKGILHKKYDIMKNSGASQGHAQQQHGGYNGYGQQQHGNSYMDPLQEGERMML